MSERLDNDPASTSGNPDTSRPPSIPTREGGAEKIADVGPNGRADAEEKVSERRRRSEKASKQVREQHAPESESDALLPKAAHDPKEDR